MKAIWTGLTLALLLTSTAIAGQPASGWNWDAPPPRQTAPLQTSPPKTAEPPDCGAQAPGKPLPDGCAAQAPTASDDLGSTLAPPPGMTTTGNRKAKKVGN